MADRYFDNVIQANAGDVPPARNAAWVATTGAIGTAWKNPVGKPFVLGIAAFVAVFIIGSVMTPEICKTGSRRRRKRVWSRIAWLSIFIAVLVALIPVGASRFTSSS